MLNRILRVLPLSLPLLLSRLHRVCVAPISRRSKPDG